MRATISAMTSSTTLRVLENGRVEHGHAPPGGGGQVDLVGADAERADGQKAGRLVEHRLGDLGAGPDAQQVDVRDSVGQVALAVGTRLRLHVEPGLMKAGGRAGVDVFQQQGAAAGGTLVVHGRAGYRADKEEPPRLTA